MKVTKTEFLDWWGSDHENVEDSVMTLEQIKQWLVNEIQHNAPVVDGTEEMSDGSYDIHVGRMECAESLLKQIEESEDE